MTRKPLMIEQYIQVNLNEEEKNLKASIIKVDISNANEEMIQQLEDETINILILLEQIKLELWTVLPKIELIVKRAKEKGKQGLIDKTKA